MKKIYAIALLAAAAVSANAQDGKPLYATGNAPAFKPEWNCATPAQFTFADGKYTLELDSLTSFQISTVIGGTAEAQDWDAWKSGQLVCDYGTEPGAVVDLALCDPTAPGANIYTPWNGKYVIEVSGDLKTLKMTTTTPKPEPAKVYFRGGMNEWNNLTPEWQFYTTDGIHYYFTCGENQSIPVATDFKIADADWGSVNYSSDGAVCDLDTEYEFAFNAGGNTQLSEEWSGSCVMEITGIRAQALVQFYAEKQEFAGVESIAIEDNDAEVYYNLQGVRVNNADKGLFIVVKGGKAVKVVK